MEASGHKYMHIRNTILEEINSGVYKPGDLIPSDNVLMKRFSVSKSTITQALKLLAQEGVIDRIQGKGSFVSGMRPAKVLKFYLCPVEHDEEEYWSRLVDGFNSQNSTFKVEISFIYNDQVPLRDTLFRAFASGNAPDIFSLDGPDMPYWAYMKSILPLDKYLSPDYLERFIPTITSQGTYRGHLYHLGYYESTLCLLFNKELFARLGIKAPERTEDAWTWEEFMEVCRQIREQAGIAHPLLMDTGRGLDKKQGEWICYSVLSFIAQNGGSIFDDTLTKTSGHIDSAETVEAVEWFAGLLKDSGYSHTTDLTGAFPEDFAMSLSVSSAFFALDAASRKRVGLIPLPRQHHSAAAHGGWGLCVASQTKHPKECVAFLKYVFSLENQLQYAKYAGLPILKDVFNILQSFNESSSYVDILFSQLQNCAFTRPVTPAYPFFSRTFVSEFLNIVAGANAAERLHFAAEQIDDHIARHNYFSK